MAEYKPTALQTSKRYLTATDVAELLGVSRSTAYRIIKRLNSELEKAGKLIEDEELREQIKTCGIGTSATRAAIIEKLQDKGFIDVDTSVYHAIHVLPLNLAIAWWHS